MSDLEIFLAMDLTKSDSVAKYIPRRVDRGTVKLVPKHIRAMTTDPEQCVQNVRTFRARGQNLQEKETEVWRNMGKQQRQKFERNLAELLAVKERVLAARSPSSSAEITAQERSDAATAARIPLQQSNVGSQDNDTTQNAAAGSSAGGNRVALAEAGAAESNEAEGEGGAETTDPIGVQEGTENTPPTVSSHVGLASSQATRDSVAETTKKRARKPRSESETSKGMLDADHESS